MEQQEDNAAASADIDNESLSSSSISLGDDDTPSRNRHRLGQHDTIGTLQGRSPRALQSRAAFLNGRPSYLLYFCEVADVHQLLQSSLQRLTSSTGAAEASSNGTYGHYKPW